ncbi:facilitated trehalose transporter Tret1-like isoform X2 [Coccinella septempunctata]|uniref:facilitated trehalose transporter Tret1-like isoform X2 n=1 Tax=Coccinella septempunctata TaxID=41139 RepID=UPI001D065597|nr:facilitated trehalose transporter Tret1-like isoform X2 [Coccinella septempunctata]
MVTNEVLCAILIFQNDRHQLFTKYTQPTISASTTATNLSDYQSSATLFKSKMATLQENLRLSQPEIEPLNSKEKDPEEALPTSQKVTWESFSTLQKFRAAGKQLVTALIVSWVSMLVGYTSGYTSPADKSLRNDFSIGDNEMSWIGGLMPLGAVLGGLLGGPSIDYFGRKWTLLLTDVFLMLAWSVNYFAQDYYYLYVSRSLVGVGVGFASLTFPVYLGETIQPEVRGTLGLLPTTLGNIGILVCFTVGMVLEWKDLAGIAVLMTLPFLLIFIWIIPETPRWYVSKDKLEDCKKSLEWLRGNKQDITKEFDDLVRNQKEQVLKNEKISDVFTRSNFKPLTICLTLMIFQQFSGINAVIFYTTSIFRASKSTLEPEICTIIIGVVNVCSTFIANALIDRLGRKMLLYISSVSMAVCLGTLGFYYYFKDVTNMDVTDYGFVPLASLIVFALGFSLGFGPIPWLMMGEILPAKIRGPAASIVTAFNWASTFVVTTTFPIMNKSLGSCYTFWFYGLMVVLGFIFTVICVPETRGKSLEDIERLMSGQEVRRMSSKANMKPLPSTF